MKIDWTLPASRKGWLGQVDKLIGPGATTAEKIIQFFPAFLAVAAVVGFALYNNYAWTLPQYLVASYLALDMVGGILTNLTSAAKRWYFREGTGFKAHMAFVAVHGVQISLASFFFLDFDIIWIGLVYGFLLISSAVILSTPLYLHRPMAGVFFSIGLILSIYVFKSPEHLEWLLPLLFCKLLLCRIVREEPYRPEPE